MPINPKAKGDNHLECDCLLFYIPVLLPANPLLFHHFVLLPPTGTRWGGYALPQLAETNTPRPQDVAGERFG